MTNFWIAFILITEIVLGCIILLLFQLACERNNQAFKLTQLISEKIKEYDAK